MIEPSFSIVVPTFRRPETLRQTLAALLALDYERSRYEVIVTDDGADEATAEIVGRMQGRRVEIVLTAQHQRGAASARNRGAQLASGTCSCSSMTTSSSSPITCSATDDPGPPR